MEYAWKSCTSLGEKGITHTHTHTQSLSLSLSLSHTQTHTHPHTHTYTCEETIFLKRSADLADCCKSCLLGKKVKVDFFWSNQTLLAPNPKYTMENAKLCYNRSIFLNVHILLDVFWTNDIFIKYILGSFLINSIWFSVWISKPHSFYSFWFGPRPKLYSYVSFTLFIISLFLFLSFFAKQDIIGGIKS